MSSADYLKRYGLLNTEVSYGDLIAKRPRMTSFAICQCGEVYQDLRKVFCTKCSHALFWESEVETVAKYRIEKAQKALSARLERERLRRLEDAKKASRLKKCNV